MTAPGRPRPPEELLDFRTRFMPGPELEAWIRETFIEGDGPLVNDDHGHLAGVELGVLWTTAPAKSKGRYIVGTAEIPMFRGKPWVKARQEHQIEEWFGRMPDALLTFSAEYANDVDNATFCALVEHELYHVAHAVGEYGPRFKRSGEPILEIRGHDVEEFVDVVRRYGAGAAAGETAALVAAAREGPTIAEADVLGACGTCIRAVA